MQSLYATQTDSNNANVKYLNNVHLQYNNLQQAQLYGNKIDSMQDKINEMESSVSEMKTSVNDMKTTVKGINDSVINAIINELTTATESKTKSKLGEAVVDYIYANYD